MRINEDYIQNIEHEEIIRKDDLILDDMISSVQNIIDGTFDKSFDIDPQGYKPFFKPNNKSDFFLLVQKSIELFGNEADLNFIDTSGIKSMDSLFEDSEFNGKISRWDVSNVENMDYMFMNSQFNGNISNWNVRKVSSMYEMFYDSRFNGNISNWDVSNVYEMSNMFENSDFTGDISNWQIDDACSMEDVFKNCPIKLINVPRCLLEYYDARDITKW
jgi:hypothetical protein